MICYNNSCSVSERNQSSAEGKTLSNPQVLVHTVYPKKYAHGFCFAVLCCGYTLTDFSISSGLLHWHCGNLAIAPVPAKQPWWLWINTSCEFIMNHCITTTKQSTTKPCAYFLGYTVFLDIYLSMIASRHSSVWLFRFHRGVYWFIFLNEVHSHSLKPYIEYNIEL